VPSGFKRALLRNDETFVRQITLFTLEVAREVTSLQVGNIGHIAEVRVSHYHIPVCEGFGLVNIMAEWHVQHPVLAFQCVKRSKSVVEVQRAFRRGFVDDRGRGPVW
jgi:hypothetical protein